MTTTEVSALVHRNTAALCKIRDLPTTTEALSWSIQGIIDERLSLDRPVPFLYKNAYLQGRAFERSAQW